MAEPPPVFTIGHSTHAIERFIALLERNRVELVADVRRFPGSRRHPQFGAEALSRSLADAGLAYAGLGDELGGRRRAMADSVNIGWRSGQFRGYADHMASDEFAAGLRSLESLATERRTAVMCAEGDWGRCHRQLIADALVARRWRVLHIGRDGRRESHELSRSPRSRTGWSATQGRTPCSTDNILAWRSSRSSSRASLYLSPKVDDRSQGGGTEVWREPIRGGYPDPGVLALPGLERLRRFGGASAPPPPLFHLTGARPTGFGKGTADAEMPATPWLLNSAGLIGGGTLAILADIAFGCAFETGIGPATPYATAELSLTFLRPARAGGTLTAHGQAIHTGRSIGLSEAFLLDPSGEHLIAHGTSRLSVLPRLDSLPEPPDEGPPVEPPGHPTPDAYLRPAPDGVIPESTWAELPGAEILARQLRDELPPPPIHFLSGLRLSDVGDGTAAMRMPASEWLASPTALLQGGTIAMLADHAMQAAVLTTTEAGTAVAGLDLKVNFLRPGVADGRDLVARAEVVHRGRTLAITRAEVSNADGKAVVLATGSSMYLPGRPASLGDVELGGGAHRSWPVPNVTRSR